jgi:hypothetical protein
LYHFFSGNSYSSGDTSGDSTQVPGNSTGESLSSKSAKASKSAKSAKSTKAPSPDDSVDSKSAKSTKSPTKASKSAKSAKGGKSSKGGGGGGDDITPAPTPDDSDAFVATAQWETDLDDAVATGQLFHDSQSGFGWYTYTADASIITTLTTRQVGNKQAPGDGDEFPLETMARLCAIDASNGRVMSPCQEIRPRLGTASSTEIQSVEACYTEDGDLTAFAVTVHDSVRFLQFTNVVGGRLIVYDVDRARVPVDVAYEGWTSLYSDPSISGRPTFSPDCETVYATWITDPKFGGASTATIAVSTTADENRRELWRLDEENNYRRFVGFTPSSDGKFLYSATNMPEEMRVETSASAINQMGMVQVNAETGEIVDEFFYEDGQFHNAYTNVVLDDEGNTYHVDSAFGIVKFDGANIAKGPVWRFSNSISEVQIRQRELRPRPQVKEKKLLSTYQAKQDWYDGSDGEGNDHLPSAIYIPAMAYRPGLDESNYETVYGSDGSNTELRETVAALDTAEGNSLWLTSVQDGGGPNGGNVITDDTKWGPSLVASEGTGVYVASGPVVQCYDSKTGSLLWSYRLDDSSRRRVLQEDADDIKTDSRTSEVAAVDIVSRIEIIDSQSVLVAANGMILRLQTTQTGMPTSAPAPTTRPGLQPTRSPTPSPTRDNDPSPTQGPRSGATPMIQRVFASLAMLCLTVCFAVTI